MIGARCALALWFAGALCAHAEPQIHWATGGERTSVEVTGLDAAALAAVREWPPEKMRALFSLRVQQPASAPAMLGAWRVEEGVLRFTPQFPLTPGLAYRAEFDPAQVPGGKGAPLKSEFTMPALPRGPATRVAQIYPSSDDVPENLLKFYVHFSAPMSRGHIYDHIHLRDEQGKEVDLPFLEIDEELWDPEMKRLTLFIDPGRIKREVKPLEELGPALQAGRSFTLAIDGDWLDAAGHPLASKHERKYRVGPADRTPITPAEWKINAPAAGSAAPLQVAFGESIDHALASRLIHVIGANGKAVAGKPSLGEGEKSWSFTPAEPWSAGPYRLLVSGILEDLAGNNIGKAFEVEMLERGERLQYSRPAELRFEVK